MSAMKIDPHILQWPPSFAVADTIATEVGGKEEKQVNSEI